LANPDLNNKLLKVEQKKKMETVLIRRRVAETGSSGRQKLSAKIHVQIYR
jgi:hypothetical protein